MYAMARPSRVEVSVGVSLRGQVVTDGLSTHCRIHFAGCENPCSL